MDVLKRQGIPSQQEANFGDPEEHFLWALRNLPMIAGSGMLTHPGFLRGWSRHLWECGFAHRDYLEGLADSDGNINVSQLPAQQKKFQLPFRGPHHTYNPAGRWVKPDEPEPAPFRVPNIEQMTTQERYALAYQLKQSGIELPDLPTPPVAQEFN